MTVKIELEDMTNTVLGCQCDQCLAIFPDIVEAVRHQDIISNKSPYGICPDRPEEDDNE